MWRWGLCWNSYQRKQRIPWIWTQTHTLIDCKSGGSVQSSVQCTLGLSCPCFKTWINFLGNFILGTSHKRQLSLHLVCLLKVNYFSQQWRERPHLIISECWACITVPRAGASALHGEILSNSISTYRNPTLLLLLFAYSSIHTLKALDQAGAVLADRSSACQTSTNQTPTQDLWTGEQS